MPVPGALMGSDSSEFSRVSPVALGLYTKLWIYLKAISSFGNIFLGGTDSFPLRTKERTLLYLQQTLSYHEIAHLLILISCPYKGALIGKLVYSTYQNEMNGWDLTAAAWWMNEHIFMTLT